MIISREANFRASEFLTINSALDGDGRESVRGKGIEEEPRSIRSSGN